jgi:hypothetical protein
MPTVPNLRSRLDRLEAQLAPAARVVVCFLADGQPVGEQLAAFRAENRVQPQDTVVTVELTFA